MIPKPFIAKWNDHAPWTSFDQIEQDLVLCRALVEIFSNEFLKTHLAFRGGTALHKLYLHPAVRYSEDIDLVQIKKGPIKPILEHLKEAISFFEEKRIVKQKANNNTILYRFQSEYRPDIRLRLKVEINCREHFTVLGWKEFPFEVESGWFSGKAEIRTYFLDELLGTKLRALYQRKKGRDLFDLYHANQLADLDYSQIIAVYQEYMQFSVGRSPSKKEFLQNLKQKEKDEMFSGDLEGLLRPGIQYEQAEAFEWIKNEFIENLM